MAVYYGQQKQQQTLICHLFYMFEPLRQKLQSHSYRSLNSELPQAAVLIPLLQAESELELIFTRRASHMSTHSGEVAFPGGKMDKEDPNLQWTALRESQEEINLDPKLVQVIGRSGSVVSRYGIEVTPFVGVITETPQLKANTQELDRIFSVPVDFLLDQGNLQTDLWQLTNKTYQMPSFQYGEYHIWGLTAIMLVEFLNIAFATNIPLDVPQFSAQFSQTRSRPTKISCPDGRSL